MEISIEKLNETHNLKYFSCGNDTIDNFFKTESLYHNLIMAKERINDFIKTLKFKEKSEIFEQFDIEVIENIMTREEQEDGTFALSWGEQKVS